MYGQCNLKCNLGCDSLRIERGAYGAKKSLKLNFGAKEVTFKLYRLYFFVQFSRLKDLYLFEMVFIKKVLIQWFKSYKEQTDFEEFHEQVNCIGKEFLTCKFDENGILSKIWKTKFYLVGKNGSGKSNFFAGLFNPLSFEFMFLKRFDLC
jgi:hypothetical protein